MCLRGILVGHPLLSRIWNSIGHGNGCKGSAPMQSHQKNRSGNELSPNWGPDFLKAGSNWVPNFSKANPNWARIRSPNLLKRARIGVRIVSKWARIVARIGARIEKTTIWWHSESTKNILFVNMRNMSLQNFVPKSRVPKHQNSGTRVQNFVPEFGPGARKMRSQCCSPRLQISCRISGPRRQGIASKFVPWR